MKLPVAYTLSNREASLDKDALIRNGMAEVEGQIARARKRPAIDSAYTTATGQGQSLFTWTTPGELGPQQALVAITNDTLAYGSSITTLTKALRFVQNPTTPQNIATSFTPSVTVEAVSKAGNRVTGFTSNVTVAFSDNPTGATLGGTLTHAAVAGLATFSNLTSDRSGEAFELSANSSGINGDISLPFNIPTHLTFAVQPPPIVAVNATFAVLVEAKDTAGNLDTTFNGDVIISLFSGTPTSILSGTLLVTAVSGIATFADLSINEDASGYILKAEFDAPFNTALNYYPPASGVSDAFNVGGFSLEISSNTSSYDVYSAFVAAHGVPPADVVLSLNVDTSIEVNGMTWGASWTGTPTFVLNNLGIIYGAGGQGGNGGSNGSDGQNAIDLNGQTVNIVNGSGFIWGGGGGGGGGGSIGSLQPCASPIGVNGGGGGGGGGAPYGTFGTASNITSPGAICNGATFPTFSRTQGSSGTTATVLLNGTGGSGGTISVDACPSGPACTTPSSGTGGNGGNGSLPGSAGSNGTSASVSSGGTTSAGTGGAAGKAINLSGGTATFISGSGSPHVLGAVS